jgi:hypothetical protein
MRTRDARTDDGPEPGSVSTQDSGLDLDGEGAIANLAARVCDSIAKRTERRTGQRLVQWNENLFSVRLVQQAT